MLKKMKVNISGSDTSAFQPFHKSNKLAAIIEQDDEQNEQNVKDTSNITLKEIVKHKHDAFRDLKNLFNSKTKIKCWPC
jgi:UDP-N-acetylmuramate-alanine ligase